MARKSSRAVSAPQATPVNKHRGEGVIVLGDQTYKLCLTMNALVEIEETMGVPLARLGEVLKSPTIKQIRSLIGALVRGGGADVTDEEIGSHKLDFQSLTKAIEEAFENAGAYQPGVEDDESKKKTLAS